ncbi:PIN domain-containing protein [Candidatus Woesearchaeota archaeon]|nr:PIN domain-containing protein [Candidatus Woesearchaeota archaeon]
MVDKVYFFDSYAIIELIRGNPNYVPYGECRMATTALNLIEVHYILLREHDLKTADAFLKALTKTAIPFEQFISRANTMKLQLNKRNISAADCVGYITAASLGIKFLTGDKEFENLENVEFVK